jgi:hypothetical protein
VSKTAFPKCPSQGLRAKIRRSEGVREGRVELPRPFGHRILRLLQPGTDPGSTCRLVSSGAVLCHPVSFRREQSVSRRAWRFGGVHRLLTEVQSRPVATRPILLMGRAPSAGKGAWPRAAAHVLPPSLSSARTLRAASTHSTFSLKIRSAS